MVSQADQARELAEHFKKHGYFDRLKSEILSRESNIITNGNVRSSESLEKILKELTAITVKDMVEKDEELIFKNRGPTSALVEAQLLKDNYKKFNEHEDGIDLSRYLSGCLQDPSLYDTIYKEMDQLSAKEHITVDNSANPK
ncbi:COMPASS component Shg1p [Monosporozyma servazzii]